MRRTTATLPTLLLTAGLALGACSGGGGDGDERQEPAASSTPTQEPAVAKATEALLALPEVDLASLDLPEDPGGGTGAWEANAEWVRDTVASFYAERWWDIGPKRGYVARALGPMPRSVIENAYANPLLSTDLPTSQLVANHFAKDGQPQEARVVGARWSTVELGGEGPKRAPQLEVTAVFTLAPDGAPVVVTRAMAVASERAEEPIGAFTYRFTDDVVGHDACRYYTEGRIVPGDVEPTDLEAVADALESDESLADTDSELNRPLEERRDEACD